MTTNTMDKEVMEQPIIEFRARIERTGLLQDYLETMEIRAGMIADLNKAMAENDHAYEKTLREALTRTDVSMNFFYGDPNFEQPIPPPRVPTTTSK